MYRQLLWIAALAAANVIWAGSYTAMKFGLATIPPLALVHVRFAASALLLLIISAAMRYSFALTAKELVRILLSGICTAACQVLVIEGLDMSHAKDTSLLYVFEPIFGIILAWIVLKERIGASAFVGLAIVLAGLAALSGPGASGEGFGNAVALGNVMIVAGIFCESVFTIVLRPIVEKKPPILIMALSFFSATLVLVPFTGGRTIDALSRFTVSDLLVMSYLVLLCSVFGYCLWIAAMKRVPVNMLFFTLFVQPLTGPLIASLAIGESLDMRVAIGGAMLIAGMAVALVGHLRSSTNEIGLRAEASLEI